MRKLLILIFLSFFSFGIAKPPQLNPRDVKTKMDEILKAHACYKAITPQIMARSFQNFLDELDPNKTYFLHCEIAPWTDPTEELLQEAAVAYQVLDFSEFRKINEVFLKAIARRGAIEEEIAQKKLPTGVKSEEFKDLSWCEKTEDLSDRILRIKALQTHVTKKLEPESQNRFFQRLHKKRANIEADFLNSDVGERQKFFLSLVLKALCSALDTQTNYFTPSEANQFLIQVQQKLFGIGAQLRDDIDGLSVVRIIENSPASFSTLKINDKIIAVDKEPVVGMEMSEAVELIRGKVGSLVNLTILRNSEEESGSEIFELELVRNEIVLEESRLETCVEPYGDGVIATVRLYSFYQDQKNSSAGDVRKAIETIKKEHKLKGVILDLRGNAGGLLTQAVNVTGLFINKGIVVSVKDSLSKLQHLREIEGKPVWDGPLFCLVNKGSASAAEIVAQALQDYGRALVLGDRETFGKGSFQIFTLNPLNQPKINPQGEYKVTQGRYYTVSGKSPQLTGVSADIVIPGLLAELDIGEKFAKFPLENDAIEPHFDDDLSDLSPFQRIQLGPLYKYALQPKLTTYVPYTETLALNSTKRIEANKNYQTFLTETKKKNFDHDAIELFVNADMQYTEAVNVMKDFLYLSEKRL